MSDVIGPAARGIAVRDDGIDEALNDWLLKRLAEHLEVSIDEIPQDAVFTEVGLSSLKSVELVTEIEERYGLELSPVLLYDYPSLPEVARMVTEVLRDSERTNELAEGA